ncbi:hypothetical protein J6590_054362 [Homalodisca vitripennis]|nr:hypothetical protein J6590_054362 [Homalodisca vitripennis]
MSTNCQQLSEVGNTVLTAQDQLGAIKRDHRLDYGPRMDYFGLIELDHRPRLTDLGSRLINGPRIDYLD